MKISSNNIVIFYGSQTGTAHDFAKRLAKNLQSFGLKALVANPEETDLKILNELSVLEKTLAIFILACCGEGEPTDNARSIYEYIKNSKRDLNGLKYSVFGLGNKTYATYNKVGKFIDKRLEELNAIRFMPLGLGDDDGNIEKDFSIWMEEFLLVARNYYEISQVKENIVRTYKLINHNNLPIEQVFKGEITKLNSYAFQNPPYDSKNPFMASISIKKNLFKNTSRKCLHIEFDLTGSNLVYEAGDHVGIYPCNDQVLVNKIGEILNVNLDSQFSLVSLQDAPNPHPFPCPTTFRTALSYYLDITSLPSTQLLKELANYASNENEKNQLELMGSTNEEGKSLYYSFIINQHIDLVTLFDKFKSFKPPIDHLIELLPRLQVRYYSISSSPKLYSNSIHITANVIEFLTKDGRTVKGVATNWLNELITDNSKSKVPIFVRKSQFRLPAEFKTPVLMIGPGTGIAPFRGFIQERDFHRKKGNRIGKTVLYYGCRRKNEDYLYQEELEGYEKNRTLSNLNVAFSRDQEHKVYVTHLLKNDENLVWEIIKSRGNIYVCGDAKNMAKDVNNILIKIFQTQGKMTQQKAEEYLKELNEKSKYQQDVWS